MRFSTARTKRSLALSLFLPCAVALLAALAPTAPPRTAGGPDSAAPSRASSLSSAAQLTPARVREAYGRVALSFEANRGQTEDASVDFLARGAGYALFLKPTEAVFVMARGDAKSGRSRPETRRDGDAVRAARESDASDVVSSEPPAVLRMKLVGADASASAEGSDGSAGKVNYFVGDDPARWRAGVPTFGRVRYGEVYPGIDVVYYGNQRQLEYDFVVAPGSDARAVALEFEGADGLEVDASGDLLLKVGEGLVRQPKPVVYQEVAGARRAVEGGYVIDEGGRVRFALGEYDARLPLVIDPVLVYSTYLGGGGSDSARDIRVDSAGHAYICGETTSTNFPTANAFDSTFNVGHTAAARDAFVAKLDADGSSLVYSTYLGGTGTNVNLSGDDVCTGIAVDSAGNAYVAGETRSTDFPTANALQGTFGGGITEGFLTKLNAEGDALAYSTYLGGNAFDSATSVAVDSSGSPYVAGRTTSSNFATLNPIQATFAGGGSDVFVTKLTPDGSALVYSTYLGGGGGSGNNGFDAAFSITLDSSNNAYITGQTISTNYPTFNPIQSTFGGGTDGDAFVSKISAAGSSLLYSTYLGGSGSETGQDITVDSSGNAHVTGGTESSDFPTANAFDSTLNGTQDAFITKLKADGSAFVYSTFIGGGGSEAGNGIEVDSSGNTYVAGGTSSADFPTVNPTQGTYGGGPGDAFVTKLKADSSALIYSTYHGGSGFDRGNALALDSAGDAYVAGLTASTNFPTLNPTQAANGGAEDAFVAKISDPPPPTGANVQFGAATFNVTEGCVPATLTVTLTGAPSGPVAVDYNVADGTAKQKTDYTYVTGTVLPTNGGGAAAPLAVGGITFAPGETEKEITVLITEDGFAEGTENLTVTLSNPRGATLGTPSTATLNIEDNETVDSQTNPIDDPGTYVCQLYHDFLHRQPDAPGHAYWTNEITQCGSDAACVSERRHNVAAAFFLSIEFQGTGFFVYRVHRTFDAPARRRPQYEEFMRDINAVGLGVEVGIGDWQQRLTAQRRALAEAVVANNDFLALYPETMNANDFVDALFAHLGATPTAAEKQAAVDAFGAGGAQGRAAALIKVVESGAVYNALYNPGFVLIEYFGFLRRDPEDPPDNDLDGYNFWLNKMNSHTAPGEDARSEATAFARIKRAEMVRAFIISEEYRERFGRP